MMNKLKLGQIVKVLRGRELDKYAIVIGIVDERFVLIADGDKRKFDLPKRKNVIHLQITNDVSEEVANSLSETGRVTNAKLRFAIAKYVEQFQSEAQKKGE